MTGETHQPDGSEEALSQLYEDLRRLARHYLAAERQGHTLQPTALVHEAYLRLAQQHALDWGNRAHVLGLAAQMMRRILVNYARARNADKRLGNTYVVELDAALGFLDKSTVDVLALETAMHRLRDQDKRQEHIVELRFYGGLSFDEIAGLMDISPRTAKRDWSMARAWLRRELCE